MKMFKKIAAAATALVMAVGMMSFGASAADKVSSWQSYKLFMYTGMPSGYENVTKITVGTKEAPVFFVKDKGLLSVSNRKISMSAHHVNVAAETWTGLWWSSGPSIDHYKADGTVISSGQRSNLNAGKGNPARAIATLYTSYPNQDASCQVLVE